MRTSNEEQAISLQVTSELSVTITKSNEFEFVLPTNEVARGYGITEKTIRTHKSKHADELIEGQHYFSRADKTSSRDLSGNLVNKQTFWTKAGVIRLGFFIKSERAKLFRTWAENLILDKMEEAELKTESQIFLKYANYEPGKVYTHKLGKTMILATKNDKGELFFHLHSLLAFLKYKTERSNAYLTRLPDDSYIKIMKGKKAQNFISSAGIPELLTLAKHNLNSNDVATVYSELLGIKTLEIKTLPETTTDYPYQYTHKDIAELMIAVLSINNLEIQTTISDIIKGGQR